MNNEFKGTPGKWEVIHSASNDAWNVVGTQLGGKHKIARCHYIYSPVSNKEKSEAKANAVLISKAPEMLEMLQTISGQLSLKRKEISSRPDTLISELNVLVDLSNKIDNLIKEATCTSK